MTKVQWRIEGGGHSYAFEINPNAETSPHPSRQIQWDYSRQGYAGRRAGKSPTRWSFSGVLRNMEQHDEFVALLNTRTKLILSTDLGERYVIRLVAFKPDQTKHSRIAPARQLYTMDCLILEYLGGGGELAGLGLYGTGEFMPLAMPSFCSPLGPYSRGKIQTGAFASLTGSTLVLGNEKVSDVPAALPLYYEGIYRADNGCLFLAGPNGRYTLDRTMPARHEYRVPFGYTWVGAIVYDSRHRVHAGYGNIFGPGDGTIDYSGLDDWTPPPSCPVFTFGNDGYPKYASEAGPISGSNTATPGQVGGTFTISYSYTRPATTPNINNLIVSLQATAYGITAQGCWVGIVSIGTGVASASEGQRIDVTSTPITVPAGVRFMFSRLTARYFDGRYVGVGDSGIPPA